MSNVISFKLLSEEVEIKRIEKASVIQTAFLMYKKLFGRDVIVTNKRVVVINNYMPAFANSPFSIFYKDTDYNPSMVHPSLLLQDIKKEKGFTVLTCKGFWIFPGQKWKIKDLEIFDIIRKYIN